MAHPKFEARTVTANDVEIELEGVRLKETSGPLSPADLAELGNRYAALRFHARAWTFFDEAIEEGRRQGWGHGVKGWEAEIGHLGMSNLRLANQVRSMSARMAKYGAEASEWGARGDLYFELGRFSLAALDYAEAGRRGHEPELMRGLSDTMTQISRLAIRHDQGLTSPPGSALGIA